MTRAALVALAGLLAGSCTVDTELGVAADIQGASVSVSEDAAGGGDVVGVEVEVRFRVGEHAEGDREFVANRLELFVGESPVAQLNVGFMETLSPGDDVTTTITGTSTAGAWPDARAQLCGGDTLVTLLINWDDRTTDELGRAQTSTMNVTCD